jgi:hypothetical protein
MPRSQVGRVLVSRLRSLIRRDGGQNDFGRLGQLRIGLDQTRAGLFRTLPNLSRHIDIECYRGPAEALGDVKASLAETNESDRYSGWH